MRDRSRMRAKRFVRTWPGLLLVLTVTVLGSTAWASGDMASRQTSASPGPGASRTAGAPPGEGAPPGGGAPAPPEADGAVPAIGRAWPVGVRPLVVRGWEPPATAYGRGHRGVDLAAAPGTSVRSVAAGRVAFAGRVAGRGVVSVELTGTGEPPLRTTYEPVRPSVKKGDEVAAGGSLGALEPTTSHCSTACLHWGLLRGRTYLNPLSLLPAWLLHRGPSRLLPVLGVPLPRP
ncbi:M23 family metallopeptidase [Streptomyces avermitilis]|uniref:murein hydrolase activator EnvC family protein n=1 Tax=Streptomyces avermitilis TaxID=33903 RepID=UPI0033A29189